MTFTDYKIAYLIIVPLWRRRRQVHTRPPSVSDPTPFFIIRCGPLYVSALYSGALFYDVKLLFFFFTFAYQWDGARSRLVFYDNDNSRPVHCPIMLLTRNTTDAPCSGRIDRRRNPTLNYAGFIYPFRVYITYARHARRCLPSGRSNGVTRRIKCYTKKNGVTLEQYKKKKKGNIWKRNRKKKK